MIKVERVTKRFGDNIALNQISFSINEGRNFWIPIWFREDNNDQYSNRTCHRPTAEKTELLGKDSQKLLPVDFEELGLVGDTSGYEN